jgi:hypothetical protein
MGKFIEKKFVSHSSEAGKSMVLIPGLVSGEDPIVASSHNRQ